VSSGTKNVARRACLKPSRYHAGNMRRRTGERRRKEGHWRRQHIRACSGDRITLALCRHTILATWCKRYQELAYILFAYI